MKIALLGSSQLALSVAWGVCQSELAQQIVLFVDTQPGSKQGHRGSRNSRPIADGIEDITLATAMSASDTGISLTNSAEALSDSDVVVLLPATLSFGFHSAQALKTTNLAMARQIVPRVLEHTQNAKILVAMPFANYISAWIHQTQGVGSVIGIANGVSTAHLKSKIASQLGLSVKDVSALEDIEDATSKRLLLLAQRPEAQKVQKEALDSLKEAKDFDIIKWCIKKQVCNVPKIDEGGQLQKLWHEAPPDSAWHMARNVADGVQIDAVAAAELEW